MRDFPWEIRVIPMTGYGETADMFSPSVRDKKKRKGSKAGKKSKPKKG